MWELWDIFKLLFPLSDLWDIGLMGCRTCDVSDLWGDTHQIPVIQHKISHYNLALNLYSVISFS
jgi:hypothetical protein